jgi:hypothetical protein
MSHPEGRLISIQQQIFFAKWFAESSGMEHQDVLDALRDSGMRLVADENEIAVDASNVLPSVNEMKEEQTTTRNLKVVPDWEHPE